MSLIYSIYRNLYKYKRKRLYDFRKEYNRNALHEPFNYEDKLIKINVSGFLYKFSHIRDFLEFVNDLLYNTVKGIKYLKNSRNIAESKRNERIR